MLSLYGVQILVKKDFLFPFQLVSLADIFIKCYTLRLCVDLSIFRSTPSLTLLGHLTIKYIMAEDWLIIGNTLFIFVAKVLQNFMSFSPYLI